MGRQTEDAKSSPTLVCVPTPEFLEAPCSWLTRVALHQGVAVRDLMDHFQLPLGGPIDLHFASLDQSDIERRAGVSLAPMKIALQVLTNLKVIDPDGSRFLLRGRGHGKFRYCPLCLKDQRTSYVPVHWRIRTWKFCPEHFCLMETGCPHCKHATVLPASLISAGPDGSGVAYLRDCVQCGRSLATIDPDALRPVGIGSLPQGDLCLLQNGRASLAALATGMAHTADSERNRGLAFLVKLDRSGLLPRSCGWLEPDELRQRKRMRDCAALMRSGLP